MVSLSKIQEKCLMLDLVKKINVINNYLVNKKDLSKILIEINKERKSDYVLTPIIAGPEGLTTPNLYTILNDFQIYNIIKKIEKDKESYVLTEKGNQYIKEEIAKMNLNHNHIYKEFSVIANKVISKYFNKK